MLATPRNLFFAAVHEAGHAVTALLCNPRQELRLDLIVIDDTYEAWCEAKEGSPVHLMGGMAAELAFGNGWLDAFAGAEGDISLLEKEFPTHSWQKALNQALAQVERLRASTAAIAVLLLAYGVLDGDDCWDCILDPVGALSDHAGRLDAVGTLIDESGAAAPLTLDDLPEAI